MNVLVACEFSGVVREAFRTEEPLKGYRQYIFDELMRCVRANRVI